MISDVAWAHEREISGRVSRTAVIPRLQPPTVYPCQGLTRRIM